MVKTATFEGSEFLRFSKDDSFCKAVRNASRDIAVVAKVTLSPMGIFPYVAPALRSSRYRAPLRQASRQGVSSQCRQMMGNLRFSTCWTNNPFLGRGVFKDGRE